MADKEDKPDYRLPGEMLTAQLLAMMENWSGYGYELAKRLEKTGLRGYNSGSLYRTLRQMERHGLITSLWDTSATGPAKRVYSMTSAGSLFLRNWLKMVEMHKTMLESFLGIGGEGASDTSVADESDEFYEPDEPAAKPEVKKASRRKASATKATATKKTARKTTTTKKTTAPKARARTVGTKATGKRAVASKPSTTKANTTAGAVSDPVKPVSKARPANKVKPAGRKTTKSSTPRTSPARKKTNKPTD